MGYPNSHIPVSKLINYRKAAGRAMQKRGLNNFPNHPDPLFNRKLEDFLFQEPILSYTGTGAEFATKTLISPEYVSILEKAAERQAAKRTTRQNYKRRCEASQVKDFRASGALGNIGNNLDGFEKPVREKRYKIQEAIQKNDLVPGKWKTREYIDGETGEIKGEKEYYKSAVCTCGTPITENVHLKKNSLHGNISVGGIATCGSVWACPVCRAKIVNQRATELETIYKKGREKGWHFHLLTLTIPHKKTDNLAALYGSSNLRTGLSGAMTKMRQSKMWKGMKPRLGYIGDIRAIEITWGWSNGFHPHVHMILITEARFDPNKWQDKILRQWQNECTKSGLGMPGENGVKIDYVNNESQVSYLSKWSVGSELQSDAAKQAKNGNFSIAELEFCLINEELRKQRKIRLDRAAGVLKAYYAAMHGQKQLVFGGLNTGWKKELGIDEIEDSGISDENFQDEKEDHLIIIPRELYQELKTKGLFSALIESLEKIPAKTPKFKYAILKTTQKYLYRHGINLDGQKIRLA